MAKQTHSEFVVQAKDTYDPANYITVHKEFYYGMLNAIRAEHRRKVSPSPCCCVYCTAGSASAPLSGEDR